MPDIRRQLIDLGSQRAGFVADMERAIEANDTAAFEAANQRVQNINAEMTRIQTVIDEQDRRFAPVSGAEHRDMVEDRANTLLSGRAIQFTADEVQAAVRDALLVGSGNIVEPVGSGTTIHDPVGAGYSSIIDQVRVMDMTGVSAWQEPYVKSTLTAYGADPVEVAGELRTESEAGFGVAEIRPYEITVTSYVDRNIERLSPASYYNKVYSMAMTALRRKISELIVNGDGTGSPIFHGITNAKNKNGESIIHLLSSGAVDINTLDNLYFAYGDDEMVGGNARLLLTKENLATLGKLRGTNEKRRLFNISPTAGNANTGVIEDGGTIIPYTLASAVGSKLAYGDPINYLLGLFGNYTVRVDESYKAGERLMTILGDAMVGGNVVVDKGFVVQPIGG